MENTVVIGGESFRVTYNFQPPEDIWGAEIEILDVYFEDEKEPTEDYPDDIELYILEQFHEKFV